MQRLRSRLLSRYEADPPDCLKSFALWKSVPDAQQVSSSQTLHRIQCTFGSSLAEAAVGGRHPERVELVQHGILADGALGVEYLATELLELSRPRPQE